MSTNIVYTTIDPLEPRTRWWGTSDTTVPVTLSNSKELIEAIIAPKVKGSSDLFDLSWDQRIFSYGLGWYTELKFLVFEGCGQHRPRTDKLYSGVIVTITTEDVIRVRKLVLGDKEARAARERIARAQAKLSAASIELHAAQAELEAL